MPRPDPYYVRVYGIKPLLQRDNLRLVVSGIHHFSVAYGIHSHLNGRF